MDEHFWINPLSLRIHDVDGEKRHERSVDENEDSSGVLSENINNFVKNVEQAQSHLDVLKDHMLSIRYKHIKPDTLTIHTYEFLRIPDEPLPEDENSLKDIQMYLQKFAVALYQILKEVEEVESDTEYYELLLRTKEKMVRMLGDIQLALLSTDLEPHETVTYEMLPNHLILNPGASSRGFRDFIVFREYAELLEYLIGQKATLLKLQG